MKKGLVITFLVLVLVISYVLAVKIPFDKNELSNIKDTVSNIHDIIPYLGPCTAEVYGYVYNSSGNSCVYISRSGCSNPFKYKNQESCENDHKLSDNLVLKINTDPEKFIIRTVTNATVQRYILVKNSNPFQVSVSLEKSGDLEEFEFLQNNYVLDSKEEIKSHFKFNTTALGEFKTDINVYFEAFNKKIVSQTEVLTMVEPYNYTISQKKITFGSCVSDLTKLKQTCYKSAMNNYRLCNQNLNKTLKYSYKIEKEACKNDYKQALNNCTIEFKEYKFSCIRYRCKENEVFYDNKCLENNTILFQGIIGNISYGPLTPVCKVNESCFSNYTGNFEIIGKNNISSKTTKNGSFKVNLAPGSYTILIKKFMNECKEDFDVQENKYTLINLNCDTGIR